MLYLDCSSGVSGDMIIGSLLDLGADIGRIESKLSGIAKISMGETTKQGIKTKKFNVKYKPEKRNYLELDNEIKNLDISDKTKGLARRILKELAISESRAHNEEIEEVHLHEAVDCVVDAVAVSLALEDLNESEIYCSVVSVGKLAPATKDLIKRNSIPIKFLSEETGKPEKFEKEITTPTGAAILSCIVTEFKHIQLTGREGYGAGEMDLKKPNVLRAVQGQPIVLLETNIDDSTPEILSYAMERLMDEGALDVHVIPVMMKKGRMGNLVRILTDNPEKFSRIIMEETNTLGVRVIPISHRLEAEREIIEKIIKIGDKKEKLRIKKSEYGSKAEFDDVKRIAKKYNRTYKEILEIIEKS